MTDDRYVFIPEAYCKHLTREVVLRDENGKDGIVIKVSELNEAIRTGRVHGNVIIHQALKDVL